MEKITYTEYYAVSIYVGENMWYIYLRLPNGMCATNNLPLVYTTQVNSASCAFCLASAEMNSKYYSPPSKRRKTKWLPEEQILSINEAAVPKFFNHSELKILSQNHVTLCAQKNRARGFHFFIVRNNPNFASADYSACTVYTKTIIRLSVVESGGY